MEENTESRLISQTFFWMFLGLLGTAIVSWYTYSSGLLVKIIINDMWRILLIAEVIVVILFSLLFKKLSPTFVGILYFAYATLNGVTLSSIFYCFELNSVIYLFLASALLFGGLALYGYKTERNVSSWNNILFAVLIVGIILSIINIFIGNSMLDIILDWIILLVFFGITVYDVNKIKSLQYEEGINKEKLYIYGAMQLYLDFINIFLHLIQIIGDAKD